MIKIAIIEENAQARIKLTDYLNAQEDLKCAGSGNSLSELEEIYSRNGRVQILIIGLISDVGFMLLPVQLRKIKERHPETEILILADSTDTKKLITCLRAGIVGYLPRDTPPAQLKEAILGIRQGGAHIEPFMVRQMLNSFRTQEDIEESLTEREKEVVQCLVAGMSYKLMGYKLNVAFDTVRYHLRNIYRKLKVNSKAQVINKARTGEFKF
jgi:DNA-binding NarL/FixJ family response regulator